MVGGRAELSSASSILSFTHSRLFLQWALQRENAVRQHFTIAAECFQDPLSPLCASAAKLGLPPRQLLQIFLFLADGTLSHCLAAYYRNQIGLLLRDAHDEELRRWIRRCPLLHKDWLTRNPLPPFSHSLLCSTLHSLMATDLGQPVDCLLCYRFCVLAYWEPMDEERFSGLKKGTGAWFWNRIKKTQPA